MSSRHVSEVLASALKNMSRVQVHYDPPYESPIENTFAWHVSKYLSDETALRKQVQVDTECGAFRLDFVIERDGWAVGVECDGTEYHQDALRDEFRDALILGTGRVRAIYRITGSDLFWRTEAAIYEIARRDMHLFSMHGVENLDHLTERREPERGDAYDEYEHEPEDERYWLSVRHTVEHRTLGNVHLSDLLMFARQSGAKTLDGVMRAWRESVRRWEYE